MGSENNFILSGGDIPPLPLIFQKMSLGAYLFSLMKQHGEDIAHIDFVTAEQHSFEQLMRKSFQLADALQRRGYRRGDVIAIKSENRLDYPVLVLASALLGTTLSSINPLYSQGEMRHVFNLTRPNIVFCSPHTYISVIEMASQFPHIREIIIFDIDEEITEMRRVFSYKSIFESGIGETFEIPVGDFSEDVAVILTSSGTTGLPKGVMLTHLNLISLLEILRHTETFNLYHDTSQSLMALMPFFHGYGLLMILNSFCLKLKLVILSKFEERTFLSCIEKYKIKLLPIVPPLINFLAKSPLVDEYDLSSLKQIWCGAAPVGKSTLELVSKRLGISMDFIKQAYGMTEMSTMGTLSYVDTPSHSVGRPLPGMKLKVIDVETGRAVGENQVGELCFKGPLIMKGYVGNPKETENTIDKEGWLHTGDIGYYDEKHNVYIVDRMKELIKVKGFQVAPAELEALLIKHPGIQDAAVIGKPDELSGEVPLAFVVQKPNSKVSASDIDKYIANLVSPQKRLKGGVIFVDQIPKNASGKILRRVLRKEIENKSKL